MVYITAYIGSREAVNAAVSRALARNPNWWVADTLDWGRANQLVAPPENLLLRLGSVNQLRLETGNAPGLVIAAVPAGPIDRAAWRRQLSKTGARIIQVRDGS